MKTLKNHVLVFDSECPMCSVYTKGFVNAGMLDKNGRESYRELNDATCIYLDKDRARNEIALVNLEDGSVNYGIDSLFKIIAHSFPIFRPLFLFTPFRWLMKKVYFFISYNRKVIIPAKENCNSCAPDFNWKYRFLYLATTWFITALILTWYSQFLTGMIPETKFYREFFICGGQLVFQSVLIYVIAKGKVMDYLGNMMTISLVAAFILGIGGGVLHLCNVSSSLVYLTFFAMVVVLMLVEHLRRMKIVEIGITASVGWVVYRLLVLILIIG